MIVLKPEPKKSSRGAPKPDRLPKPPKVERTATPSVKRVEPPHLEDEAIADPPAERVRRARKALGDLPLPWVHFLMKISPEMSERLEVERARRGLRSRVATIMDVLERAVPK